MSENKFKYLGSMIFALSLSVPASFAQMPPPTEKDAHAFPAQDHYSPYAGRGFPTNVYWGDTHLHTGMSMDAGAFGARLMPEDAHRFARGEEVTSSTGQRVKLSRPLDFLVVADHSDNMGFFPRLAAGDPKMLADPTGIGELNRLAPSPRKLALGPAVVARLSEKFPLPNIGCPPGLGAVRQR